MKRSLYGALFGLVLFFSNSSHAGLYLEPYLGYSALGLEANVAAGGLKGSLMGARVGYAIPLVVFALDVQSGDLDAEIGGTKLKGKTSRTGLTLVFSPPVLPFNLLAGYYNASLEHGTTKYKGSGSKLGVMFTMLPFLNINAEYYQTAYDENSLRDKGLMLGLSVDFTL